LFKILWPFVVIIPLIVPMPIVLLVLTILIIISPIIMFRYSHQKKVFLKRTDVKWWVSTIFTLGLICTLGLFFATCKGIIYRGNILRFSFWLINVGLLLHLHSLLTLKQMFHAEPAILERQTIVSDGPYQLVRHPIYLAYILLHLGMSLTTGRVFIGLLLTTPTVFWAIQRAMLEETLLADGETKDSYLSYASSTPMLFPTARSIIRFLQKTYGS